MHPTHCRHSHLLPLRARGLSALLSVAALGAHAATYTWNGSTALWNSTNWLPGPVGGSAITAADTAVIGSGQVSFAGNDTFGNHATAATPLIQLNTGGTLASGGFYNAIIGLNLNGGTLLANGGVFPNFGAFALKNSVTVTGSSPSFITLGGGSNNNISVGSGSGGGTTTFTVADVTGSAAADLTVTANLNGLAGAAGAGLTKAGPGTMVLSGDLLYTGLTLAQEGTLRLAPSTTKTLSGSITTRAGGVLEISGPVTQLTNNYFATGNGVLNTTGTAIIQTGGTLDVGGNAVLIGGSTAGNGQLGQGTLTINGGTMIVAAASGTGGGSDNANVWMNPYGTSGTSTLNLNAGTFSTARTVSHGGAGGAVVNFNGGTFQYASAAPTLNVTTANVRNGGAVFDTQAFNPTLGQALVHSTIGGDAAIDGGLTKTGAGTLTLSGGNTFTGNLVINQGTVATTGSFNNATPSTTNLGNMTTVGRQIQVNSGATLSFGSHDPIGSIAALQPTSFVVDGGTVTRNNFFVTMPAITLQNGALLTGVNGANSNYQAYNLMGTVTVSGATGSSITSTGTTNVGVHLGQNNIDFAVADTGSPTDLTVSAPLINKPGSLTASGITKTGAGTMLLSGANAFTGPTAVNGGVLVLSGGASLADGAALTLANTAGAGVQLNSSETVGSLAGGGAAGGHVNLQGNTLTAGGDNSSTAYSGVISGAGSLVKAGSGTLTLNANNTFSGALTVGAGTVTVSSGAALSAVGNVTTRGGGVLRVDGSVTQGADSYFATGNGVASTTGTTVINAGASVTVGGNAVLIGGSTSGNGQYGQGTLTINGGTFTVGAQSGTGGGSDNVNVWLNPYGTSGTSTLNLDAGTFSTARSIAKGSGSSTRVNLNGGLLAFTADGRSLTVDRVNVRDGGARIEVGAGLTASVTTGGLSHSDIGGDAAIDGGLVKTGAGTLSLGAASSYTGPTTISAGTLRVASGGTLPVGSAVAVNSGATLTFTRNDTWGIHTSTVSSPITVNAGGTLASSGFYNTIIDPVFNGGQLVLNGGANPNFGAFAFKGTVAVTGSTPVSFTTGTGVNNSISVGPTTVPGVTTFSVADVSGSAATDLTVDVTLKNNLNGPELANGITKTGPGTMLLSAANTYTGPTNVDGGLLILSGGAALHDASAVTLANTAGVALRLDNSETIGSLGGGGASGGNVNLQGNTLNAGINGNSTTYSGVISGPGGLIKSGAGTLTLTTAHAYSGPTQILGGTLEVTTGNESTLGVNPLGANAEHLRLSGGTLRVSGADLTLDDTNRGVKIDTGSGTFQVDSGRVLTLSTPFDANSVGSTFTKAGAGTFNLTSAFTANAVAVRGGVYNQNAGVTRVLESTGTGLTVDAAVYNLNGGTLRTDLIKLTNGGVLNWGATTLTLNEYGAGSNDPLRKDHSSAGYHSVRNGRSLTVQGDLASSSGSSLRLHGSPSLYISGGLLFDGLFVDGTLDLTNGGTLAVELNPYLLRPFSPSGTGVETGSLPLVIASGGITGQFSSFTGVGNDGLGFAQDLSPSFPGLGSLAENTWYLEYRAGVAGSDLYAPSEAGFAGTYDVVFFHYKVAGYVPEPGTMGLFAVGVLVLRLARRRRG